MMMGSEKSKPKVSTLRNSIPFPAQGENSQAAEQRERVGSLESLGSQDSSHDTLNEPELQPAPEESDGGQSQNQSPSGDNQNQGDNKSVDSIEMLRSAINVDNVDFVLVWCGDNAEANTEKAIKKREIFEANLEKEGLILSREVIKAKNYNFVKILAPLEVLQRYAEILKIQMPIKEVPGIPKYKRRSMFEDLKNNSCFQRIFRIDPDIFPARAEHRMTKSYNKEKHYLFDINQENMESYFSPAVRSRIVQFILKRKRYRDDDKDDFAFGCDRLIESDVYCGAYPLHDGEYNSQTCQRGLLYKYWGSFSNMLKYQPLDAVKEYFGVKVAVYFAWLGFYTRMLIFPTLLGLVCFIYGIATVDNDVYTKDICESTAVMCPLCHGVCDYWYLNIRCNHSKFTYMFDNDCTAVFAFLMSIWTVLFLEFWKRYQADLNHRWDLTSFDEREQIPRPEYLAKLKNAKKKRYNVVTNTLEPAIPFWKLKVPFTILSFSFMLALVIIALAAVLGVIVYRLAILVVLSSSKTTNDFLIHYQILLVNISAAFINLTFILLFSKMYKRIAKCLTELEIPRTQQEYESSYALKLYILQFINHYASIFYIAYYKGNFVGSPNHYRKLFGKYRQEECGTSCMPELCIQLAVIMIGKQAKNAILEMVIPFFKKYYKRHTSKKEIRVSQEAEGVLEHQMTKDFELLDWENDDIAEEYLEMVIQYGFVTVFVAAFPLAPLFALLNNILEVRLDAKKILKYYKRPVALRAKGIGVWYMIIDNLAKFAVLSNAFIIAITSHFIPKFVYRFYIQGPDDPNYGKLNGFLQTTLCNFSTADINRPEAKHQTRFDSSVNECSFPTYRHSYVDKGVKYTFKDTHWKVWLGRLFFVIAFQNIVALCCIFLRWAIPDISEETATAIQREEYLTNELIMQNELLRARGVSSKLKGFKQIKKVDVQGIQSEEIVEDLESEGSKTTVKESASLV